VNRSIEELQRAWLNSEDWQAGLRAVYELGRQDTAASPASLPVRIRQEVMGPHFAKYHIEGLPIPAVLHYITQAEPHADPHDHPWGFTSFVITGGYEEEIFYSDGTSILESHWYGEKHRISARRIHRIVRLLDGECWTLVLPDPWERKPGFYRWDENGQPLYRPWDREDFQPLQSE